MPYIIYDGGVTIGGGGGGGREVGRGAQRIVDTLSFGPFLCVQL